MKWSTRKIRRTDTCYMGRKNKIIVIIDKSSKGWYFYGGGYNSLFSNMAFNSVSDAQIEAEKWIDSNYKTAFKDY